MQLGPGTRLTIRNAVTGQYAYFTIQEFYEYKSQYILYGETGHTGTHVLRGVFSVAARPGCFAILPGELGERVSLLVKELRGLPLVAEQNGQQMWILNMAPLKGFWEGKIYDRDGMILMARKMIDLYQDWKAQDQLPMWFRELRAKARSN